MSSGHDEAYHDPAAIRDGAVAIETIARPLDPRERGELRRFLDLAFAGDFSDHHFTHALGGVHVLARAGSVLVGHASIVERPLAIDGRWHRAGYVEAVAVSVPYRRRGIASCILRTAIPALRAFDLGALSTGSPEVYARLGWQLWRGPTFVETPAGVIRTADDDGGIMVLAQRVPLDLDRPIMCRWRTGDVW